MTYASNHSMHSCTCYFMGLAPNGVWLVADLYHLVLIVSLVFLNIIVIFIVCFDSPTHVVHFTRRNIGLFYFEILIKKNFLVLN